MKKKITNKEVGQIIGKLAEKIRNEINEDFRVAYSQMGIAEQNLVETFDEKQMALYKDFCEKREDFYLIAQDVYKRKF